MRSRAERRADALDRLENNRDVWVATSGADGSPGLVPVSLCWHEPRILLATREDRPLARNLATGHRARLGLGAGEDVVLIEATAESVSWSRATSEERRAFVARAGWDPDEQTGSWVLLRLTPQRIRVWRTVAENETGAVVMRGGRWLP